ncbi:hypothetical protein [Streptomyces flaveolus]|uniref:hypothetical protein n=1 Tax=Streptomyces flaveolus TaxID=67297 RepID=UPI0033E8179C
MSSNKVESFPSRPTCRQQMRGFAWLTCGVDIISAVVRRRQGARSDIRVVAARCPRPAQRAVCAEPTARGHVPELPRLEAEQTLVV